MEVAMVQWPPAEPRLLGRQEGNCTQAPSMKRYLDSQHTDKAQQREVHGAVINR